MVCKSCGNELPPVAKFCKYCGAPAETAGSEDAAQSVNVCANCGISLNVGAKFCPSCGAPVSDTAAAKDIVIPKSEIVDVNVNSECVHWDIVQGQIALKLDTQTLNSFGKVKGIVIQEGVKAIFFADGKIAGELSAGKYIFNQLSPEQEIKSSFEETGVLGATEGILRGVRRFLVGSNRTPTNMAQSEVSVVLVRETDFPLVYEFKDMPTAQIRSDVALQAFVKITNILSFYKTLLLDKNFVSFETFAQSLRSGVQSCLESVLAQFAPEQISSAQASQAVLAALNAQIAAVYPFVAVQQIIRLSANREELEQIRAMQEELYISEKELEELTKRNNFLNRLNNENNAQLLSEAQTQADFAEAMGKIDQQNLLTEDEKDKFARTLYAQRQIREAQSDEEVEAALAEIRKAGILREGDIEELEHQRNSKRLENEIELQRKQDAYADERRRAEIGLDNEELSAQMELLRQAQAMREERESAQHQRELESRAQEIAAQQDMTKLYAGMTAEQIMVSNPNITPEAAQAMAEKFKAEASDDKVKMALAQKDEMRQFMEQQMDLMRTMVAGQQQTKNAEIERIYNDAEKHQDRMSQVMQTTVRAVAGQKGVTQGGNTQSNATVFCPSCGAKNQSGASFCESCGASL